MLLFPDEVKVLGGSGALSGLLLPKPVISGWRSVSTWEEVLGRIQSACFRHVSREATSKVDGSIFWSIKHRPFSRRAARPPPPRIVPYRFLLFGAADYSNVFLWVGARDLSSSRAKIRSRQAVDVDAASDSSSHTRCTTHAPTLERVTPCPPATKRVVLRRTESNWLPFVRYAVRKPRIGLCVSARSAARTTAYLHVHVEEGARKSRDPQSSTAHSSSSRGHFQVLGPFSSRGVFFFLHQVTSCKRSAQPALTVHEPNVA